MAHFGWKDDPSTPYRDDYGYIEQLPYGVDARFGLGRSAEEMTGIRLPDDACSGGIQLGGYEGQDGFRGGIHGNIGVLPKQEDLKWGDTVSPFLGGLLGPTFAFDPTALTGEVEALSAEAELSLGEDGFTAGAQATGLGVAATMGDFGDTGVGSDTEEQLRLGVNGGLGGAVRLHWDDEDGDQNRELGFGLDLGFGSMDFKTEDPLRSGLGLASLGMLNPMLPEGNLTNGAVGAVDSAIMNSGNAVCEWLGGMFADENQGLEPR